MEWHENWRWVLMCVGALGLGVGMTGWWHHRRRYTLADLGPMLRKQRAKRGLTQQQAGLEAGLPHDSYGRFERGRQVHSIDDLRKLAESLGMEGRDFL